MSFVVYFIYIVKPKARLEHGTGGAVGVGGGGSSRLVHLLWNSKIHDVGKVQLLGLVITRPAELLADVLEPTLACGRGT